jgi:hypothetical protein
MCQVLLKLGCLGKYIKYSPPLAELTLVVRPELKKRSHEHHPWNLGSVMEEEKDKVEYG